MVENHGFDVQFVCDQLLQGADLLQPGDLAADDMRRDQRLAHLEIAFGADGAAQLHRGHDRLHLRLQRRIAAPDIGLWKIAQVHTLGQVRRAQVPVERLADERDERRGDLGKREQHGIQRGIGLGLVGVIAALPEAAAAAADVPVGQILDEADKRPHGLLQVVGIHCRGDLLRQAVQRAQNPTIKQWRRAEGGGWMGRTLRLTADG